MKTKFKIGDRVQVTSLIPTDSHNYGWLLDKQGTVTSISYNDPDLTVLVRLDKPDANQSKSWVFNPIELSLIDKLKLRTRITTKMVY